MVYGYLLIGAFMMVSCLWGVKHYNAPGRGDIITTKPTRPTRPWRPGRPGRPTKPTKKPSTQKPIVIDGTTASPSLPFDRDELEGVVGDGWFSNDVYFGWEEGSYSGLPWGTGQKLPVPGMGLGFLEAALGGIGSSFAVPPKLPSISSDWLADLQKVFNQGDKNKLPEDAAGLAGWLFAESTSTTTTEFPEYQFVSDYNRIVVTAAKDHLKPPRGGWGVDYNPYFYFYG